MGQSPPPRLPKPVLPALCASWPIIYISLDNCYLSLEPGSQVGSGLFFFLFMGVESNSEEKVSERAD